MVLTPEEQADIEERFEALERRNARLERLVRSGKAFTNNPLALATDLDDLGSVKTFLEFEEQSADPVDTPLPTIGRVYAKEDVSGSKPYWQSDSGDVHSLVRPEQVLTKLANQTRVNSTTLVDDDTLKFSIGASENWVFHIFVFWQASTAGDIKFNITVPSGAAGRWGLGRQQNNTAFFPTYIGLDLGTEQGVLADSSSSPRGTIISGTVFNSTTAGDVTLQFAQLASDGTASVILSASWLQAMQAN